MAEVDLKLVRAVGRYTVGLLMIVSGAIAAIVGGIALLAAPKCDDGFTADAACDLRGQSSKAKAGTT